MAANEAGRHRPVKNITANAEPSLSLPRRQWQGTPEKGYCRLTFTPALVAISPIHQSLLSCTPPAKRCAITASASCRETMFHDLSSRSSFHDHAPSARRRLRRHVKTLDQRQLHDTYGTRPHYVHTSLTVCSGGSACNHATLSAERLDARNCAAENQSCVCQWCLALRVQSFRLTVDVALPFVRLRHEQVRHVSADAILVAYSVSAKYLLEPRHGTPSETNNTNGRGLTLGH
jgi:hypothetical protein